MRLLLFIHSLRCGGAERVAVSLANHWAVRGWSVTLVTLAPAGEDFYELDRAVTRVALDLASGSRNTVVGAWRNLRRVCALRQMLVEYRPEVALSMMSTGNVLLALAATAMPGLVAIGAEHSYPPQMPLGFWWRWLRRAAYGRLSAVVALTNEGAHWLRTHTAASRVVVIPNIARWPLPTQGPVVDPQALLPAHAHVLLAVGRLSDEKQLGHLVDTFGKLAERHPKWMLALVGDGPARADLERRVEISGLRERVVLSGRIGNVGDWYDRADLYVMTSRFEGFPNTLAEAMAYGLPVVSYDCDTGPRDLIRHGVDGLLVRPSDRAALAAALDRLMSDDALRASFARRVVEARERFSEARITSMWERLFAELRDPHD